MATPRGVIIAGQIIAIIWNAINFNVHTDKFSFKQNDVKCLWDQIQVASAATLRIRNILMCLHLPGELRLTGCNTLTTASGPRGQTFG